ncbi:MAG: MarP family serine protease [Actinobacteria bacterium]|nr:MarP family serine protease [Actinomycetota bacterium]MBI3686379.1 MarP family serine protease [Actinomycetota bacterium]
MDLLIVGLALLFAVNGFRQGLLVSALSFVGFLGGAALGLQIASPIATRLVVGTGQVVLAVAVVMFCAMLGQVLAVYLGNAVRQRLTWRPARVADSAGGAVTSFLAVLLVAWMVATPLASAPFPGLASAVRRSAVIHAVDGTVPASVRDLYQSLRQTVRSGDFPEVFGPLSPTQVPDVPAPDPRLASSPVVSADRPSVVKIVGVAPSCSRRIEGSGFVIAAGRVLTNAHVVAGVRRPTVQTTRGTLDAVVVLYDPDTDIAVLDVPGLTARPLRFATRQAKAGQDAIITGFPQDGPFFVGPARVRTVENIRGPNIYSTKTVVREVYAIRGTVRSGNSGGPLLATDGTVYGVIFAAALDDPQTGFVLTADQVDSDVRIGIAANRQVSTGSCD